LEKFRELVRAEPALAEVLQQPLQIDEFIALALTLATERGLALTGDMLSAAMRSPIPRFPEQLDVGSRETELSPDGWLPARAFWRDGHLYVQWSSFLGERRLKEPFFEWTVRLSLFEPFNRLVSYCTPIEQLWRLAGATPAVAPQRPCLPHVTLRLDFRIANAGGKPRERRGIRGQSD
jgi:hypothetical protein